MRVDVKVGRLVNLWLLLVDCGVRCSEVVKVWKKCECASVLVLEQFFFA